MDTIAIITLLFVCIILCINYYNISLIERFDESTNSGTINDLLKTTANLYKYVLTKKKPNITVASYIKSHQDGSIINIEPTDNAGEYYVKLNGGYLKADKYNNYGISKSDERTNGEIFKINNIYDNEHYYKSILDIDILDENKNIGEFGIIKSKVNGQCLSNNNANISLDICKDTENQRWSVINNIDIKK